MEMDKRLEEEEKTKLVSSTESLSRDDGVKKMRMDYLKSAEQLHEEVKESRRHRYRSKIDRAKKDYFDSKASVSDLYKEPEEFEKKFNVSIEQFRKVEAPRGPYLEYLGKNGSLHSLKVISFHNLF